MATTSCSTRCLKPFSSSLTTRRPTSRQPTSWSTTFSCQCVRAPSQPTTGDMGSKQAAKSTASAAVSFAVLDLLAAAPACAASNNTTSLVQHMLFLADIDARTAGTLAFVLRPILSLGSLLMLARTVLSWYPQVDERKLPWAVAYIPTEPLLKPTRKTVPPVNGVDVSPIVWVAIFSFANEILLGPQGILNLLQRKADL